MRRDLRPDAAKALLLPITGALIAVSAGAVVWEWLALAATVRFFRDAAAKRADDEEAGTDPKDRPAPAASVLVPLKGGSAANRRSLLALLSQDYPAFDVTVGVDERDDEAIGLVSAIQQELRVSGRRSPELQLAEGPNRLGGRPKVGNLYNALRKTRHPVIAMVDADVTAGRDFLTQLLLPLQEEGTGLTTALYRASPGGSIWSRIDGLWTSTTYLPSALFGRRVIGEGFAFGAAIAMRRSVLDEIGGFEAIAPRVGDDYQLGQRTAAAGYRVAMVPYVVTEQVESISLRDFVSRRARWSRTIRTFQPAGYAGLCLTFGIPLALLGTALSPSRRRWRWLALVALNRLFCASLNRRFFEPDAPAVELLLVPVRDLLAVWVWMLGFRTVPLTRPPRP